MDEWTPLRHQNEKDREDSCSTFLSARPLHGRPGSGRNREKSITTARSGEERGELLDFHTKNSGARRDELRRIADSIFSVWSPYV